MWSNDAPPLLQHRARRGAIPLVDRDAHSRVRFEADALVRYLDTAPLREELARGLEHRLEEGPLVDPERVRDRLARLDRMGLEQPDDQRGVFRVLERADLIEGDLADRLGEAAGQRNLLVHGYADIDDAQIWAGLAQLDGLRAFALAVNRALER